MNTNYTKMKMQDSYRMIQNNRNATLGLCGNNGMPYLTNICYDTDCYCGCIKLFFDTCRCGDVINIIRDNNEASILINNNNCNGRSSVLLEGTINILPPEVDCCCNIEDKCHIDLEFIPTSICGRRYQRCNN